MTLLMRIVLPSVFCPYSLVPQKYYQQNPSLCVQYPGHSVSRRKGCESSFAQLHDHARRLNKPLGPDARLTTPFPTDQESDEIQTDRTLFANQVLDRRRTFDPELSA